MPRVARIVLPGRPHHITQRGNNRQDIFCVDDDLRTYLRLLQEAGVRYGFEVLGYCLMSNHIYSCALDDIHAWRALVYVERNPVRAKMVRLPWRYPWSSASAHVGGGDGTGLLDLSDWKREWRGDRWKVQLERPQDELEIARIRGNTHRGRPLASDSFLSRLERRLGRRLRALPVGRPTKRTPGTKRKRKK